MRNGQRSCKRTLVLLLRRVKTALLPRPNRLIEDEPSKINTQWRVAPAGPIMGLAFHTSPLNITRHEQKCRRLSYPMCVFNKLKISVQVEGSLIRPSTYSQRSGRVLNHPQILYALRSYITVLPQRRGDRDFCAPILSANPVPGPSLVLQHKRY